MDSTQALVELLPATPALVLQGEVVRRNAQRLADYAASHGLNVRPHAKTHKSVRLAKLQLAAGAAGLTVAKVGEAQIMASCCDDLLLAYPAIDPARTTRLAKLARERTVRIAVDSSEAADALAAAANAEGIILGLLVDLDVGPGRTGVQSPQEALALAEHIRASRGVRLDGLFCYPGHVWAASAEQAAPLAIVSERLAQTLELWRRACLAAPIVSGGSTPTAYQSHLVPELTEIRPGTYLFNDMNTVKGGYCQLEDCAALVVATVVSTAVSGQVVIDAGSKVLTSDRCVPAPESGHGYLTGFPQARIVKLSEEHAQIDVRNCSVRPRLGQRLCVIPNHVCPCVNLQDEVYWHENGQLEVLSVDARGRTV